MPRFIFKRWWAVVFTLAIVVACTTTTSYPVRADGGTGYLDGGSGDGGGGGTDIGDPDVPTSPSKGKIGRVWTVSSRAVSVGDGNTYSVQVMGLRVLLQSFTMRWFGI